MNSALTALVTSAGWEQNCAPTPFSIILTKFNNLTSMLFGLLCLASRKTNASELQFSIGKLQIPNVLMWRHPFPSGLLSTPKLSKIYPQGNKIRHSLAYHFFLCNLLITIHPIPATLRTDVAIGEQWRKKDEDSHHTITEKLDSLDCRSIRCAQLHLCHCEICPCTYTLILQSITGSHTESQPVQNWEQSTCSTCYIPSNKVQ